MFSLGRCAHNAHKARSARVRPGYLTTVLAVTAAASLAACSSPATPSASDNPSPEPASSAPAAESEKDTAKKYKVVPTSPGAWLRNDYAKGVSQAIPVPGIIRSVNDRVAVYDEIKSQELFNQDIVGFDWRAGKELWRIPMLARWGYQLNVENPDHVYIGKFNPDVTPAQGSIQRINMESGAVEAEYKFASGVPYNFQILGDDDEFLTMAVVTEPGDPNPHSGQKYSIKRFAVADGREVWSTDLATGVDLGMIALGVMYKDRILAAFSSQKTPEQIEWYVADANDGKVLLSTADNSIPAHPIFGIVPTTDGLLVTTDDVNGKQLLYPWDTMQPETYSTGHDMTKVSTLEMTPNHAYAFGSVVRESVNIYRPSAGRTLPGGFVDKCIATDIEGNVAVVRGITNDGQQIAKLPRTDKTLPKEARAVTNISRDGKTMTFQNAKEGPVPFDIVLGSDTGEIIDNLSAVYDQFPGDPLGDFYSINGYLVTRPLFVFQTQTSVLIPPKG